MVKNDIFWPKFGIQRVKNGIFGVNLAVKG